MDSRQWQSPAAAAAAAEAAEEDTGGAGGPSRRPSRRGMHRASPYADGPRRWLPVASRIFPTMPRDRASSDINQEVRHESLDVISERQSEEPNTNAASVEPTIHVSNKVNLLLEGDRNSSHGNGLSDIENIINQRHFSRQALSMPLRLPPGPIKNGHSRDLTMAEQGRRTPSADAKLLG